MNRRKLGWGLSLLLAGAGFAAEQKPNIILILADDLGYGGSSGATARN